MIPKHTLRISWYNFRGECIRTDVIEKFGDGINNVPPKDVYYFKITPFFSDSGFEGSGPTIELSRGSLSIKIRMDDFK